MQEYGGKVSAYSTLKKATSLCHHLTEVGQEKAMCTEQVELAQSYLVVVHANLDALKET